MEIFLKRLYKPILAILFFMIWWQACYHFWYFVSNNHYLSIFGGFMLACAIYTGFKKALNILKG